MMKSYNPYTPSTRKLVTPSFDELNYGEKKAPKSLFEAKRRTNGRNHNGHITIRHKGGGHKKKYRIIDFKRDKENIPAKVASIEYDPNRTAYIALLNYNDGEKRFIIAPQGLNVGDTVMSSNEPIYKPGYCMQLKNMPIGSVIHNIELVPGRGGQLVRSAGLSAQVMGISGGNVTLKMPSGEVRMINEDCRATFGSVSNAEHSLIVLGKAGRARWLGIRPTVRGVHMNPVDHPNGGGEGRGKGRHLRGHDHVLSKGYKTRSPKRSRKMIIKERSR